MLTKNINNDYNYWLAKFYNQLIYDSKDTSKNGFQKISRTKHDFSMKKKIFKRWILVGSGMLILAHERQFISFYYSSNPGTIDVKLDGSAGVSLRGMRSRHMLSENNQSMLSIV